jgi:16S rRNA (adenine1518-N6/adenine1519-N6)-dimethyltransferase
MKDVRKPFIYAMICAMKDDRIRPKKSLGQHFLLDKNIIDKIINVAHIMPGDTVVEIGPGRGSMTSRLADVSGKLIAIELDNRLYTHLKEDLKGIANLELIHEDALGFAYEDIPGEFKVVANLPYYISTPMIFRLMEVKEKITSMTLMLQKEVAERIIAAPGTKEYGVLSISVGYYCHPRIEFYVSRNSFSPKPNVDSAVLTLLSRKAPSVLVSDISLYFKTVRASFSSRRKVLKNALRVLGFSDELIGLALEKSGIDPKRRGETLSIEEFAGLSDTLFDMSHKGMIR